MTSLLDDDAPAGALNATADGAPPLCDTPESIAAAISELAKGSGPVAIDTERASGFISDNRACVIQLRREGTPTYLLDAYSQPAAVRAAARFMSTVEWILHSAADDLPCLITLGWRPARLYDTQRAGTLLGLRRTNLQAMLQHCLGVSIPKGMGQENWARRPLSVSMRDYAALDVEYLIQLHHHTQSELEKLGRLTWYEQECQYLARAACPIQPLVIADVKGVAALRRPRHRAVAAHLHQARQTISTALDIPLHWVLPHQQLINVAASRTPHAELAQALREHGRRRPRFDADPLFQAINIAFDLSPSQLRQLDDSDIWISRRPHKPPLPTYSEMDAHPIYEATVERWRDRMEAAAGDLGLPVDSILTMTTLRGLAWHLTVIDSQRQEALSLDESVFAAQDFLVTWGCRVWQIELILDLLDELLEL